MWEVGWDEVVWSVGGCGNTWRRRLIGITKQLVGK